MGDSDDNMEDTNTNKGTSSEPPTKVAKKERILKPWVDTVTTTTFTFFIT